MQSCLASQYTRGSVGKQWQDTGEEKEDEKEGNNARKRLRLCLGWVVRMREKYARRKESARAKRGDLSTVSIIFFLRVIPLTAFIVHGR